jgi:hypothetical protein
LKLPKKNILNVIIISILIISCGKKEEVKFEAFSPEAFAFDIGDVWEVNATVNVKGFNKVEKGDVISASLSYSVDMIKSDGDIVKNIFSDSKEIAEKELNDMQIEAQFELDTTYSIGIYQLAFNISDNNSGKNIECVVEFELSN